MRSLILTLTVAVVGFASLAGCSGGSGSSATVKGTVKYKGALVKVGTVTFVSADKSKAAGSPIKEDGTYSVEQAPVGEVVITVDTSSADPQRLAATIAMAKKGNVPANSPNAPPSVEKLQKMAELYTAIPAKYADAATSPLKHTVQGGAQEKNIELE